MGYIQTSTGCAQTHAHLDAYADTHWYSEGNVQLNQVEKAMQIEVWIV